MICNDYLRFHNCLPGRHLVPCVTSFPVGAGEVGMWGGDPCGRPRPSRWKDDGRPQGSPLHHPTSPAPTGTKPLSIPVCKKPTSERGGPLPAGGLQLSPDEVHRLKLLKRLDTFSNHQKRGRPTRGVRLCRCAAGNPGNAARENTLTRPPGDPFPRRVTQRKRRQRHHDNHFPRRSE
jgi:hypothetical protein